MNESEPARRLPSQPPLRRRAIAIRPPQNLFDLKGGGNDCSARMAAALKAKRK